MTNREIKRLQRKAKYIIDINKASIEDMGNFIWNLDKAREADDIDVKKALIRKAVCYSSADHLAAALDEFKSLMERAKDMAGG